MPPKRSRSEDEDVPDTARSSRAKRENGTVSPDGETAAARSAAVKPNRSDMAKLLIEKISSDDADMVEEALDELSALIFPDDDEREEAYQLGAHSLVTLAMQRWTNNQEIQYLCCKCLMILVCNVDGAFTTPCQKALVSLGAIDTITNALKRFPNSEKLQDKAFGALGNIMYSFPDDKFEAAKRSFVQEQEGIELIVGIMERFPDNAKTQDHGCFALLSIADVDELKKPIIKIASVVVAKALSSNFGDETEQVHEGATDLMNKLFG